jgi:hypothetical protein
LRALLVPLTLQERHQACTNRRNDWRADRIAELVVTVTFVDARGGPVFVNVVLRPAKNIFSQ